MIQASDLGAYLNAEQYYCIPHELSHHRLEYLLWYAKDQRLGESKLPNIHFSIIRDIENRKYTAHSSAYGTGLYQTPWVDFLLSASGPITEYVYLKVVRKEKTPEELIEWAKATKTIDLIIEITTSQAISKADMRGFLRYALDNENQTTRDMCFDFLHFGIHCTKSIPFIAKLHKDVNAHLRVNYTCEGLSDFYNKGTEFPYTIGKVKDEQPIIPNTEEAAAA
jgi:hypothetical protein